MNLKELQRDFLDNVIRGKRSRSLLNVIQSDSVQDSLQIYQNNYKFGVLDAIKNNFRTSESFMGEEKFSKLCFKCIDNNPSRSGNLDDYALIFFQFVRNSNVNSEIEDLVTLDYYQSIIYDDADPYFMEESEYSHIEPSQLNRVKLELNPTLRKFTLFNANSISLWHNLFENKAVTRLSARAKKSTIAGFKNHEQTHFMPLTFEELTFLNCLEKRKTLQEIFEIMEKHKSADRFQYILLNFIKKKLVNKFTFN
ncbi:MAG: putative DNA-binding domain-containing protein [Rickettsiales bacterium]